MTRFLVTTLPTDDLGLLTRSLPIAGELVHRGHSVTFCNPAEAPRTLIAEAGFDNVMPRHALFDLLATDRSLPGVLRFMAGRQWKRRHRSLISFLRELIPALPLEKAHPTAAVWDTGHAGAIMGMLDEGFVRANIEAMRRTILETRADVVLDFWNPFAVIAARALRKPVISVIQADAHPGNRGFIWWLDRPADLPNPVFAVNKVMAELGLPPIGKMEDLSLGDLTLCVGMPETDPLPAGSGIQHVGAIVWEGPDAELPSSVLSLPDDKPLIWLYSGNPRYRMAGGSFDSHALLRASIDALGGGRANVAVTTGHHPLPQDLLPLPPNFIHEPYVPGLAMAAQSDLLIHHGGYGSCQTGLLAGKAAVIAPTFSERESNARRMAALGAALTVPVEIHHDGKRIHPLALRVAVESLLADRVVAANAKRAGERLRTFGGAVRAADLIERFVRDGRESVGERTHRRRIERWDRAEPSRPESRAAGA